MNLAPIALFVYNRPIHTRNTIESLLKNDLASASDLYIFSDAPFNFEAAEAVREVREYIRQIDGFASVTIIEREANFGLSRSIIEGVTFVVNKHGRIIVLEDDIVTSRYFLDFMNRALDYYANELRVWHISGWNYPIDPNGLPQSCFIRAMFCWGWATWADRWKYFRKEPGKLLAEWDAEKVNRFNLDGSYDFWDQVKKNAYGNANTWGVFWYATIFEHGALCLVPAVTYVENIGLDNTGMNCDDTASYSNRLNADQLICFPGEIVESRIALARIQQFCDAKRPSMLRRVATRLRKYIAGTGV